MSLKANDFIEIEFTGKIKNGEVFDSNIKEVIEEFNLKTPAKPFIFALGQGMFLKGVDDFLIGKEPNKEYKIELSAENAFGKRDAKLIQLIPMQVFKQHKINPVPGFSFNFDGRIGKILSVSGGRIRVDFNNPLSGKDIEYNLKVLRKIKDKKEEIKAFNEFLFRKDINFDIDDKKITLYLEPSIIQFAHLFKDKFKEIFNLDLDVKEIQNTKKE